VHNNDIESPNLEIDQENEMTNIQVRLIASALGLVAGAIVSTTDRVDVNVGLAILVICGILFLVEYFRSQQKA
jgi:hypothetical protein